MEHSNEQVLLRAEEVCRLLGWSEGQFYMACRRGQLPARKLGRRVVVLRSELEEYLVRLPRVARETMAGVA